MAVSPIITAMQNIFATSEYATRIPEYVRNAITSGNFGQANFTQQEYNQIMDVLVDKISRQDIYSFRYNNFDASRYEKGYLSYGGIIEDDFVEAMTADEVTLLPSKTDEATWDFKNFNPFEINYPSVKPSYYMLKIFMQYHVTTTTDIMKRAFTSEAGASDFINRVRGVLPESGKLDKYLLFRNMLTVQDIYPAKSIINIPVAGDHFTAEESINAVKTIRNYVKAFTYNQTQYNKLGVLNNSNVNDLTLFISTGILNELSSAQYNAYHRDIDFGCKVEEIDGFGAPAATTGQFATLVNDRGVKIYKWMRDRMDNIWNPKGEGYWNTFYSFGDLMGYSMHENIAQFRLTDGQA